MTFEFSDQDQTITIHHFNTEGIYLSSSDVLIEANTGLPANSTVEVLPDMTAEQVAIYREGHWVAKNDHRGRVAYAKSRLDAESYTVEDFSDIPDSHTLDKPGEFDSWTDGCWQYDIARYRPVWIEEEKTWQQTVLSHVEVEIVKYQQDQTIPEKYSELRVTAYSEPQYYKLLMDRKLLNDYVQQSDFPDCGRPTLSGQV